MSRYNRGHARNAGGGARYVDPAVRLAANFAWRADNGVDNGTVTTDLPSYVGSATLTRQGTGQAIKAASANLGGRFSIAVNGVDAAGGYGAVALGGAPSELTLLSVFYQANVANGGVSALTTGGTVDTGASQVKVTTLRSKNKNTIEASAIVSAPTAVILASVITDTTVLHYQTRFTAVSASAASSPLAGTSVHLMCRAGAASVPTTMTGEWAWTALWTRALTPAEVQFALRMLSRYYAIPIAA